MVRRVTPQVQLEGEAAPPSDLAERARIDLATYQESSRGSFRRLASFAPPTGPPLRSLSLYPQGCVSTDGRMRSTRICERSACSSARMPSWDCEASQPVLRRP